MEMLSESIAATCPSAFSQPANDLFLKAVSAVVAAHCGYINSDDQWPKDDSDIIFQDMKDVSFDFIVVGAGTAGSVVASRLAQARSSWKVLLVEAGGDPDPVSDVPSFVFYNMITNQNSNWLYKTETNKKSCLALENRTSLWHKGKCMGGSSSINAMLYVRGHPDDFNDWSEKGNPGWSYEDLLPYFEKVESKLNLGEYEFPHNSWYNTLSSAWDEVGYRTYNNVKNEGMVGATLLRTLISKGKRLNSAKVYLGEIDRLKVIKNSKVEKLTIDLESKKVIGVEIKDKFNRRLNIKANKEVILSAGSIGTPQLLMLSGIGPKEHLDEMNTETIENLQVGKNLQDHLIMPLIMSINQKTTIRPTEAISFILQYMLSRTGAVATIKSFDFMNFANTENKTNYPNIQFYNSYHHTSDDFVLSVVFKSLNYRDSVRSYVIELNKVNDLLIIYPSLLHPKSKGEILLHSTNPKEAPLIKPNYLNEKSDINTMVKAIELVERLETSSTFIALGIKLIDIKLEECAQYPFRTKPYWECYVKHMTTSVYHSVGTTKMGPREDGSVVNHELLVYGIKNLRVVDASIMPSIPGGNTMAATLAIAEKGADIIKNKYINNDEL